MLPKNSKMEGIDDETVDALPEKAEKGSKANLNRASRNKSEKDRRDKVNAFINELANLVPGCSPHSKKLDKATILKNTVDFMKVHNDLTVAITRKDTTSCLNSNELGQLMLEGYHAFLFVISLSGNFKFVSESVYDLLGYVKDDLVMKNVFDYIISEDKITLLKQLTQDSRTGTARNSGSSSFYIRFKRNLDGNPFYETLRCCGNFRTSKEEVRSTDDGNTALSSNESCFVVLAKLIHPHYQRDASNWLSIDVEFSSRQSLDGKFLYLDPRCIPITGYLPYEILGSMIYEYIHYDDLENISKIFDALLEEGEGETEDYRFLTKGCQWIVIKTSSYISYNHWNSKPEFICSTHQLVRKRVKFITRGAKSDESSSVQVDDISSASTWKIENFDDNKSDVVSGLNTPSTLLRNNQRKDSFTKKVNSTALSTYQVSNEQVSYSTANSLARTKTGGSCMQTSQNIVENGSRDHAGSGRNDSNLIPNCQQPNGGVSREMPRNEMIEKNRQSPGAIAATYWSGQSTSVSPYDKFQNPLAVVSQSRQQNAERLASTTGDLGNVRIDRYPQSPRVSQGYAEPRAQMPTGYPHVSTENTSNVWQIAGQTQKPPDTQSEFTQPGSQTPHGYFPSSSVNLERSFQPPRRKLSGIFQSFSSFPGTVLPSSGPSGENYASSPTTANVMPPHGPARGRHSQSPSDIAAEYSAAPARAIHLYPQSPPKVSSESPQSYQTSDGYFSSASLSPSSPYARTAQGYPPSNTTYPSQSPVPTLVGNRYSHSSGSFTPVSFPLASPYSSVSPQSPDNSSVSSQSPHYTASSESVTSSHHHSPARTCHIPTGTSELYPIPTQSSTNYPHSLYDHPDRCPMVSGIPTQRCLQSALSPHPVPQNTLSHPRSPDCNPLRSSALPSARDNVFIEQSGNATRSRQLDPSQVNDLSQFPLQPDQRDLSSVNHVAQVKKSGEESLRPCQIGSDCRGSQNTAVRSPVDRLDRNNQTADQFSLSQNKETRSQGMEMFSLSRTISQHDFRNGNDGQNMNYESQTSDQSSQQIQEQTFNSMQNATVNSMIPTKNVSSTYVQARIILQNQLLEKQNHLQKVIQNQKAQLIRIQEQIVLNAQAQFSINDIGDLESTKQLQQHVYDLEGELKRQETRQKDLKAIFVQKVGRGLAHEDDGEMHSGGISSSNLDGVSFNCAALSSVTSQVPDQSDNSYPGLSELTVNVSVNIPPKAHEIQCGSTDIANKSKLSQQDNRQTGLNQEFSEEENLFSGVLPHDKGKLPLSAHYSPVMTSQPIIPHYRISSNIVLSQPNNDELSLNQHRRNSLVNASTGENFGSSSNQTKDYFSKFTASELETFLSSSSFPSTGTSSTSNDSSSSDDNVGKEEITSPSTYDSLLLQQKRLLEMQEEQRRQLVRRQQEQLSRLQQRQQQQQQRMLLELQHTPENTQQEPHNLESQILSHGDVIAEDTSGSVLSHELSDEDLSVVNMLLAEEVGPELWTDEIFDKTTSAT